MTMHAGWTICTLEDLLALEPGALTDGPFGSSLKSEHYTDAGCRVIRLNNVAPGRFNDADRAYINLARFETLRRHEAKPGDLVTAALGEPLGRTCIVPEGLGPAIVKADCFRTRLHPRIDARLISFWLNSPTLAAHFAAVSKGVGRVRINSRALRTARLPLPPIERQRALATRLEHIQARADAAQAEATKALRAADALRLSGLRAGVTGALTVRARAAAAFPEPAEALLARVPAPAQDGGGRSATDGTMAGLAAIALNDPASTLPEGWRWTPLLRIAAQGTGHTPSRKRDDFWNGDIPWLGIADAREHQGRQIADTLQKITAAGLAGSSARLLPASTVCMSRTASVGYVTMLGKPMATSQDFVTWTCSDALLPEFLMYALMAEGRGIRRFGRGSTHTTIYMPELRALYIALPPIQEQRAAVTQIERILARAAVLRSAASSAIRTARQLLPRAVTQAMAGRFENGEPPLSSAATLLDEIAASRRGAPRPHCHRTDTNPSGLQDAKGMTEPAREAEPTVTPEHLSALVRIEGGELSAVALWRRTELTIERFYPMLRDAVARGLLAEAEDKEFLRAP